MRRTLRIGLLSILLGPACSSDSGSGSPDTTLVYESRRARQCETDGLTAGESAQTLIDAGIDVLDSTCGYRTGIAFAAVCGAPTADILVHEIRAVNAPHARDLGFDDVETLVDADDGTGYRLVDCDER